MKPELLKYLIEQAIEEELAEANAIGMGGVIGNATLAAGQKPDHSILWSGDDELKEGCTCEDDDDEWDYD